MERKRQASESQQLNSTRTFKIQRLSLTTSPMASQNASNRISNKPSLVTLGKIDSATVVKRRSSMLSSGKLSQSNGGSLLLSAPKVELKNSAWGESTHVAKTHKMNPSSNMFLNLMSRTNLPTKQSPTSTTKPLSPSLQLNREVKQTKSKSPIFPEPSSFGPESNPDVYMTKLLEIMLGFNPTARPTLELSALSQSILKRDYFKPLSEEDINGYGLDVLAATREQDIDTLRSLHKSGRPMSCANQFGESLLHMACRRGFLDVATFLLEEGDVTIRITDDCGRTPLHDTLWNRDCQFKILEMLLKKDPLLLLARDKRGATPFAYCRREHWGQWKQFLWEKKEVINSAIDRELAEIFRPTEQEIVR